MTNVRMAEKSSNDDKKHEKLYDFPGNTRSKVRLYFGSLRSATGQLLIGEFTHGNGDMPQMW